jgi:hypothetical protein
LGSVDAWVQCLKAFGLSDGEALKYDQNPIDNLAAITKAKIPILHIVTNPDIVIAAHFIGPRRKAISFRNHPGAARQQQCRTHHQQGAETLPADYPSISSFQTLHNNIRPLSMAAMVRAQAANRYPVAQPDWPTVACMSRLAGFVQA